MKRTLIFVLVAAAMILAACNGAVAIVDVNEVAAAAAATAVAQYAADNPPAAQTVDPTATTAPEETQVPLTAAPSSAGEVANATDLSGLASHWLNPVGVLTGIAGDAQCAANPSCWFISPDTQEKLTLEGETVNLDEGAYTMCSFGGGMFAIGDVLTAEFEFVEFHQWFLIVRGVATGPGDRNMQVTVTGIAKGFVLCTHLPPGLHVSDGYVSQNVDYGYAHECGEYDHCTSSTLVLLDVNDPGNQVVLHQPAPDAPWEKGAGGDFTASK